MLPVIAIVGRPNVGKSTLFNRLTRSRLALVSDFPGLTRDRQYSEADVAGQKFIVIDTAGLSEEENNLDKLSTQQSLQALEEADLIIFLVDARAGVTANDQAIALQLRSINKPIFLTANKAEGLDTDIANADFFQLGLGTPHAISASHGQGIESLIETMFAKHPPAAIELAPEDSGIKLAIIGRPNVGKSTLTNRLLGEERVIVYDQPGTTRDSIFIPLERFGKKYTLIDTAGIRRRGKIFEAVEKFSVVKTLQAIQESHVVLFVIDAREGVTDQDLRLLGFILECGKSLVIAINKWDGMTTDDREKTRRSIDRKLHFLHFARIHFISALHGSGVGNLFDSIDEAYTSAHQKLQTSQLTRLLEKALAMHSPPQVHGRRIKLRYAHAGGHHPPTIIIHGNQVEALPESYQKYLANMFQKHLKLVGTPVRIQLKSGDNPFKENKKRTKRIKKYNKNK